MKSSVFLSPLLLVLFILALLSPLEARKLRYVEEFYRLYYLPHQANKYAYHRNIFWLQIAMKAEFAPPIQALVVSEDAEQYQKYQKLLKMHLNYLMAKNSLYLGARFDKHQPVWFNRPYKEDILKSLEIARYHYSCAINYWEVMLRYKDEAASHRGVRVDLDFLEDMVYQVDQDVVNLLRVAQRKLDKLENTIQYFQDE